MKELSMVKDNTVNIRGGHEGVELNAGIIVDPHPTVQTLPSARIGGVTPAPLTVQVVTPIPVPPPITDFGTLDFSLLRSYQLRTNSKVRVRAMKITKMAYFTNSQNSIVSVLMPNTWIITGSSTVGLLVNVADKDFTSKYVVTR